MNFETQITYVGHATLLIELDGARILTDPVLRRRLSHLRHTQPPHWGEHFQNLDGVLISHMHFDHLDLPSLRLLGKHARLIVPRGAASILHKQGFRHIEELRADEVTTVAGLRVRATHALHDKRRHPLGARAETLGYVVEGSYQLYFAGDTDIFPEMETLAEGLDVALLPVWGWGPTLGKGHMNPQRAAEALQLLRPRLAIPIHWGALHPVGMGWLKPRFLHAPPYDFSKHATALAPNVKVRVLAPGGKIALQEHLPLV